MSKLKPVSGNEDYVFEIAFLFLAVITNPLIYLINFSVGTWTPDSAAYLKMGEELFRHGNLYIPSWGHIDSGLILPPLYPAFIAIGQWIIDDGLRVAEWVSNIAMILAGLFIYLITRSLTIRSVALLVVLCIYWNYYFIYFGTTPITEATFLLTVAISLYVVNTCLTEAGDKPAFWLLLGACCALVFFSRQIGLFAVLIMGGISLLKAFQEWHQEGVAALRRPAFIAGGFLVLLIPYSLVLYAQTGQWPTSQSFRQGQYAVTANEQADAMIEQIKAAKVLPNDEYKNEIVKRRLLRVLLPDASEMLSHTLSRNRGTTSTFTAAVTELSHPLSIAKRLTKNVRHLIDVCGPVIVVLFSLLCLTPFSVRHDRTMELNRIILPALLWGYLLTISLFTDAIPRYVYVLFPFVTMQIGCELYFVYTILRNKFSLFTNAKLIVVFLFFLALMLTPRPFYKIEPRPKLAAKDVAVAPIKKIVAPGDPIYVFSPFLANLVDGDYRIIPNDSFPKVVKYALITGVRWLLLTNSQGDLEEQSYYGVARWLDGDDLHLTYPNLVNLSWISQDGTIKLYEIKSAGSL